MYRTKIWAHRGASGYAPENTLEAFNLAVRQKADGVELDVQMTKDGQLVVIHDESIERVSDGTGYVKDFTLRELREFNFNRTRPEYARVQIPTLAEVYECLKPTGMTINVEMKTGVYAYPGLEEILVALTEKMGMTKQVVYSSFNHLSVAKVKALSSEAKTGILYVDVMVDTVDYARRIGVDALHPGLWHMQMPGLAEEWLKSPLDVHVWTVNEERDLEEMIGLGVDAVITNYPDRGVSVRERMKSREQESRW
ncbi:MAG: glycerophosphodiester phosphodiesterase [Coprococcus sp.]